MEFSFGDKYRVVGNSYYFDPGNEHYKKIMKIRKSNFKNNYLFKIINLLIYIRDKPLKVH